MVKLTIDIPKGYERDFIADKFKDFFSRVIADITVMECVVFMKMKSQKCF